MSPGHEACVLAPSASKENWSRLVWPYESVSPSYLETRAAHFR